MKDTKALPITSKKEYAHGLGLKSVKMTCEIFGGTFFWSCENNIFTARLQSATTTAGNAFEMDAIASCYVGGVSASGGVGRVTGTIIGALVMSALSNGMNLMNIGISYQYMVRGAVLVLAVLFDVRARRMKV